MGFEGSHSLSSIKYHVYSTTRFLSLKAETSFGTYWRELLIRLLAEIQSRVTTESGTVPVAGLGQVVPTRP
jgi:hypothetical protein